MSAAPDSSMSANVFAISALRPATVARAGTTGAGATGPVEGATGPVEGATGPVEGATSPVEGATGMLAAAMTATAGAAGIVADATMGAGRPMPNAAHDLSPVRTAVMRVAFITHYADMLGANRSLLNLIDGLRAYGVESFVVTPDLGDFTKALAERGIAFRELAIQEWVSEPTAKRNRWQRLYLNLRVLPHLVSQLRKWRVQVVYSNSSVICAGQVAARLLRLPHIWHFREFGDLDYGMRLDWGKRFFNFLISKAQAQIAISNAIRDHLLQAQAKEKIHVIYNGIAPASEFDRLHLEAAQRDWGCQPFNFLVIGMFHPAKQQEEAIRAFAQVVKQVPAAQLLLAGPADNNYGKSCRDLVTTLGLSNRVTFLDYVADPFPVYLQAHTLLMCSKHEGMGRVTAEAMATCLPVIGRNSGATPELIQHEQTGLLYDGSINALVTCMTQLARNPAQARQLGMNGWEVARQKFTVETYSQQVFAVLESVCPVRAE